MATIHSSDIPQEFLDFYGYELGYVPGGYVTHLAFRADGAAFLHPVCQQPYWLIGTGTQDEWETARDRIICKRCQELTAWRLTNWKEKHDRTDPGPGEPDHLPHR